MYIYSHTYIFYTFLYIYIYLVIRKIQQFYVTLSTNKNNLLNVTTAAVPLTFHTYNIRNPIGHIYCDTTD